MFAIVSRQLLLQSFFKACSSALSASFSEYDKKSVPALPTSTSGKETPNLRKESNAAHVPPNVKRIYSIVEKATGAVGGNEAGGPIYGEMTLGSFQKIVHLLKTHTSFDSSSWFIDIGSGLGKPNLHVAQEPGVHVSVGIEVIQHRYNLSMLKFEKCVV
ncbi:MAG: hypothetical protein ACREBR_01735 [bacterium]